MDASPNSSVSVCPMLLYVYVFVHVCHISCLLFLHVCMPVSGHGNKHLASVMGLLYVMSHSQIPMDSSVLWIN